MARTVNRPLPQFRQPPCAYDERASADSTSIAAAGEEEEEEEGVEEGEGGVRHSSSTLQRACACSSGERRGEGRCGVGGRCAPPCPPSPPPSHSSISSISSRASRSWWR